MLQIERLTKSYPIKGGTLRVLNDINLNIEPGEKVAILGRNGAGKSTLIRIIGDLETPDSGNITRGMSISWPLGYSGGMQGSLTGYDNIAFLCRVYGVDQSPVADYVRSFTELGRFLKEPVKTYSAGMKGRLNFALSMAFDFDCLLIDEGLTAGDSRFADRCHQALEAKKDCAILMVAHAQESIRQFCQKAYVLEAGSLLSFNSMDDAYHHYNA
ncbi:ABC transporter ATP-binding protein [Polynucleobacter sp. JS-Fieb-80-E5]|uniref:ABC transporter ATP-binding protein n=1 Tax=Polynucleobacter sp. JS-Fieb-80-E5 TaxID=2081050 RepID=UPI001C0AF06A|nr:ABC transporter ATP-binding protein [Polynucleobacter sp. JS-Fieb-80-E5]MBU3618793.1 ABC transporter ATP-binding protein [Polynucleobacter sp. JS-Fieb-80-E5]